MRHLFAWVIAATIAGSSATAGATCEQISKRRAVCSSGDGKSYVIRTEPQQSERPRERPQLTAAKPTGRWHLEGGVGPVAWLSLSGPAKGRAAVGGEVLLRGFYAWRPRERGIDGIGGAVAEAFVGNHVGVQIAGAVAATDADASGRARIGLSHRIAIRRFWVPALLSVLPSVGFAHERDTGAQLELTTELPFGVVATKHLGVELRPGIFHRRGAGAEPRIGVCVSLSLVLF